MRASTGAGTGWETAADQVLRPRRYPFWIWWNLLSLDAPTVVCLWALLFLRALHLPFRGWELPALAATVWIIYASDRMLDGLCGRPLAARSDRHNFYARHGRAMLGVLLPIAVAAGWIGLVKLGSRTRMIGLVLCFAVMFYFLVIHAVPDRADRWFPKELAAGAIFAAGAAIPAWSLAAESGKELIPAVLLFGGLCSLNCVAIECWEHNRGDRQWEKTPYWLIRWADGRIAQIAAILLSYTVMIGIFGSHSAGQSELLEATAISLSLSAAIEWQSNHLSPRVLRVLADAALLTPALFLLRSAV